MDLLGPWSYLRDALGTQISSRHKAAAPAPSLFARSKKTGCLDWVGQIGRKLGMPEMVRMDLLYPDELWSKLFTLVLR